MVIRTIEKVVKNPADIWCVYIIQCNFNIFDIKLFDVNSSLEGFAIVIFALIYPLLV